MTTPDDRPEDPALPTTDEPARTRQTLRERADTHLRLTGDPMAALARTDLDQLVHDLRVHQIELEMQNEELRRSEGALTAARDRYVDLYDAAPTGYVTLDLEGKILEANLPACTLFGINRTALLGQPLLRMVAAKDQPIWRRHFREYLTTGALHACELELAHTASGRTTVHVESVVVQDAEGSPRLRTTLLNITARVHADAQQQHTLALLTNILHATPDLIFVKDLNLRTILCNDAFAQACGKPPVDVLGHTDIENGWDPELVRGNPDTGIRGYEADDREALCGTVLRIPSESVRVGADIRLFDTHKLPLRDATGHIIGVLGVARDITEQTRRDALVLEREQHFRALFDHVTEGIITITEQGTIQSFNPAAERLFGYTAAEVVGQNVKLLMPNPDHDAHDGYLAAYLRTGQAKIIGVGRAVIGQHKDGTTFPLDLGISEMWIGSRRLFTGILRDLTEQQQITAALTRFKHTLDQTLDCVFIFDAETWRFLYCNKGACEQVGYSEAELLTMTPLDITPDFTPAQFQALLQPLQEGAQRSLTFDTRHRHKDGHDIPVEIMLQRILQPHTTPHFVAIVRDITARKREAAARQESDERLRLVIQGTNDGIWDWNIATHALYTSARWHEILGYREGDLPATDTTFFDRLHPDDRLAVQEGLRRHLEECVPHILEIRLRHQDGTYRWCLTRGEAVRDAQGQPVRMLGSLTDITERKEAAADREALQDQIRQLQKTEALGQLAAGIAHDFNNILAAILGNTELSSTRLAADHPVQKYLAQVLTASDRAAHLVQQILAFTHHLPVARTVQSLAPALAEALALLRTTLPAHVVLRSTLDAATPAAQIDSSQLHQIVLNLCTNAWHALGGGGGQITVSLGPSTLTDPLHAGPTTLPPGRYVRLSVQDTGCGIDAETMTRIFDPFFTTKPVGQGTGLGLSVVQGLVQGHAGALVVESVLGQGTTVHVYFPAADAPIALAVQPAEAPPVRPRGQTRRVLYVEDEPALVELAQTQLLALGYEVSAYTEPAAALAALRADPAGVDVLITDYNMPGLSGLEVVRAARGIRADLPVVLTSGYLSPAVQAELLAAGVAPLLLKPVTISRLVTTLAQLFAAPPQA